MTKKLWLILVAVLALSVGCGQERPVQAPDATATPSQQAAEPTSTPAPSGVTILADGVVQTEQAPVVLSFETAGKLLDTNFAVGDIVEAGDLVATLDDSSLQETIVDAELQVQQAENSVAQAQLSLDELLDWQADETAVALAEANLAAAEAALAGAETQDATAGNSLTSARVGVEQAERGLADAQAAYTTAFDPGREWEYHITEPSCLPGQGGVVPCTGVSLHIQMKNEREGAERAVEFAEENLEVARAQYNLAAAGLNNDTAVGAQASVVNAELALQQALEGPKASEVSAARLQLEQAQLALQQSQIALENAQNRLDDAQLLAAAGGTVQSVDAAPGTLVSAGTPIVTLLDQESLQFHTNNLSERDLSQIEPGQTAVITLKAFPDDRLEATVIRVGLQAGAMVGDAATFPVILALEEADLDILPGMTGRVEIRRDQ